MAYLKDKWEKYLREKSIWAKISDAVFIVFVVTMLIPASRREVSALLIRMLSFSPGTIETSKQTVVPGDTWQWKLVSMDGKLMQLADTQGKPIVVNFWATWCPPCVAELPEFQELYDHYHDRVSFLFITDEDPVTVRGFLSTKGYSLPIHFSQSSIPEIFRTNSLPTTYVLDPNGHLVIQKTGAAKWNSNAMHKLLDQMLLKAAQ